MTAVPRVLLVGHDASRTGAPVVASSFVRWAVRAGAADVRVALLAGGPLVAELRAVAPTTVATPGELVAARALGARAHEVRLRAAARAFDRAPVVVANTVAAWATAATVARRSALVCWVHELDQVADALVAPERRADLLAATDRFVAAGDAVATMLTDRWRVPAGRVTVVEPFVDPPTAVPARRDLSIVGAGALVPRKGADAFVAVLASLRPDAWGPAGRAAWLGGPVTSAYAQLVQADLRWAGLAERVALPGAVPSLDPWWPEDGLLLHPAREDPAPLVVTEAALRRVPVVTWDTGGAADLLRSAGCGELIAPAGDLLGLAERVERLLADPDDRQARGRALAATAADRVVEVGAPRALEAILGRR